MTGPFTVIISRSDYLTLSRRVSRVRTEVRDSLRARIILAAQTGTSHAAIARQVGVTVDTVRKWCHRFHDEGIAGLKDRRRSGRPRTFSTVAVAEVKALAGALPAETNVPLSRWSHLELAREAISRGIVEAVSAATVRRWLRSDAIKPWQVRSWIFPRDPDFQVKAGRVLDLYSRVWDGEPLGPDDYVISGSAPTRSPNCKPSPAGTLTCRRGRVGAGGRSSSTGEAAPWPTSPLTTCTTRVCSASAHRRPAFNHSNYSFRQ